MANKKNDAWNDKKQSDKTANPSQYQDDAKARDDKSKKTAPCKDSLPG